MFTSEETPEGSIPLTPELIDAAVTYVETACKTKKGRPKIVYKSASGFGVSAQSLKVVLDHDWLTRTVSHHTCVTLLFRISSYV
jgi:hypothetical protein